MRKFTKMFFRGLVVGAALRFFHRSSLQGLLKFSRYSLIFSTIFLGLVSSAYPQNPSVLQPNCQFGFSFTAPNRSSTFQNITPAGVPTRSCTSWTVVYSVTGFSALSIEIDSAPDGGALPGISPGSWTVWPTANIAAGQTLPMTTTSCTITNPCAITVFGFAPWVSVNLNSVTGTGTVSGTAYGWQVQGSQESNTGSTQVQGVSPAGGAVAGNPVVEGISDTSGNTQRIRPSCESPASLLQTSNIALSGTTTTQFIALAAGKAIHLCSMSVGNGGGTTPTFSLQFGTGTNCATGLTTLIPNTVIPASTAAPQQWTGHIIVPSGNAACYILTGTTPTGNLTVTFSQQ